MLPKRLLPPDMMDSAFIAGGYAACPALARDIDLWVTVPQGESLRGARNEILAWLEIEMWPYEAEADNLIRNLGKANDGYTACLTGKVAIVRSPHMTHPIHIMVTSVSPADLLETFDVSTHQVAIVFGNVIKGTGWTPVTEPPRMLKMTPTTPERMEKIAARYGHSLTPQGTR